MNGLLFNLVICISGFIIGGVITGHILSKSLERKRDFILKETLDNAEKIKKEKLSQTESKMIQFRQEFDFYVRQKNEELSAKEKSLINKELTINQKIQELLRLKNDTGYISPIPC
jgi:ribonucrease Y